MTLHNETLIRTNHTKPLDYVAVRDTPSLERN